jgi:hypothetical protein
MANIDRMSKNVYRLELWNVSFTWNKDLDQSLDGHYTIYWHVPTEKFLVYKHGSFGGLTYYIDTNNQEFENNKISQKCLDWIESRIKAELKDSVTWEDKYYNHNYARNIIFDYDYQLFSEFPSTRIGKMAVEMLENPC